MKGSDEARERFSTSMNCAQSILTTYCEDMGLDVKTALRLAAPFGGGMSRKGEACGAISGALMVIGLKYGSSNTDDKEIKAEVLRISQRFMDLFKEKHGTVRCNELLGVDIGTKEGQLIAKEKDLFNSNCPGFVSDAAGILEIIFSESKDR